MKSKGNFSKKNSGKPKPNSEAKPQAKPKVDDGSIRLNRYVANSGMCSRREADIYIEAGSVTVNGKPVTSMGYKVQLGDEVKFDGKLITPSKMEYVLLNKPKDFDTVTRDEQGRRSALQLVSNSSKSPLIPVDRLNKTSSGLILFTNDGAMVKALSAPKNGLLKIYHITLDKPLVQSDLDAIKEGIALDGKIARVKDISYVEKAPRKEVGLEIKSTRKNLARRIFEQLGYEVVHLDRVVYAGLTKKDLPRGNWRYLTEQEIINLKMMK